MPPFRDPFDHESKIVDLIKHFNRMRKRGLRAVRDAQRKMIVLLVAAFGLAVWTGSLMSWSQALDHESARLSRQEARLNAGPDFATMMDHEMALEREALDELTACENDRDLLEQELDHAQQQPDAACDVRVHRAESIGGDWADIAMQMLRHESPTRGQQQWLRHTMHIQWNP